MILERKLPKEDLKNREASHIDLLGQPTKLLHSDLELLQRTHTSLLALPYTFVSIATQIFQDSN